MNKVAIIFYGVDGMGHPYKYVNVCDKDKADKVIERAKELNTEIEKYEVVSVTIY